MFACEDCTRHFCHGVIVFAHGRDNLADSERIHKLTNAAGVKICGETFYVLTRDIIENPRIGIISAAAFFSAHF